MIPRIMTPQQASSLRLPLSYLARIPELKVYISNYIINFKHNKNVFEFLFYNKLF